MRLDRFERQPHGEVAGNRVGHVDAVHQQGALIGARALHVQQPVGSADDAGQQRQCVLESLRRERDVGEDLLLNHRFADRRGGNQFLAHFRLDHDCFAEARELEDGFQLGARGDDDGVEFLLFESGQREDDGVSARCEVGEGEATLAVRGLFLWTAFTAGGFRRDGDAGRCASPCASSATPVIAAAPSAACTRPAAAISRAMSPNSLTSLMTSPVAAVRQLQRHLARRDASSRLAVEREGVRWEGGENGDGAQRERRTRENADCVRIRKLSMLTPSPTSRT